MAKNPELKTHFDVILGRDAAADFPDAEVLLREIVGAYSFSDGNVTAREIGTTGNSTKRCGRAGLLDVSGVARTGADGTSKFVLEDFFCRSEGTTIFHPVNFVATPLSRRPIFLTATRSLAGPLVVEIEVRTWDAAGSPAANISFDWRCRIRYTSDVS